MSRLQRCRWPYALGLAVAGLAGIGLAAEAFCRYGLGLGTPPLYEDDPQLEYRFRPNQELQRFGNHIAINNLGLRGAAVAPSPAAGTRRVLLFGDSLLWGGAQLDQSKIATTLLPALLGPLLPASASGAPLQVVAAAVPSWGPANWLAFARRFGFLGASHALLLISSHDAVDWPSFEPLSAQADKPTTTPPLALLEAIERYGWPALRKRWPLLAWASAPPAPSPAAQLSEPERQRRSLAALAQLIDRARAAGVATVAVQFSDRYELSSGVFQPGHAAIAAVLRQRSVPALHAGPEMAACARRAGVHPASLYVDEIHPYTPLGQQCLAAVLAKALTE